MDSPNLETASSVGAPPAVVQRADITFEEYLERSSETRLNEWVDGEIIELPGANFERQSISGFLQTVIGIYVEKNGLGLVLHSPFPVKLEKQRRGREPDILFIKKDRIEIIRKTYIDGPVDLAIEIISPESITRDRAEKFVEYEAAGIPEYWLIDPSRQIVDFYGLGEDGQYHSLSTEGGVFHSQVLAGFFLRIDWLWKPFPSSIEALRELGQL